MRISIGHAILTSWTAETENRQINVHAGVFKNKSLILRDEKFYTDAMTKKKKTGEQQSRT